MAIGTKAKTPKGSKTVKTVSPRPKKAPGKGMKSGNGPGGKLC